VERLEIVYAIDELTELWKVKALEIETRYVDTGEFRGIDAGYKVFYVLVAAVDLKLEESGEVDACQRRRTTAGFIGKRLRGIKAEAKHF
jgi:hypothetical protein